MKYLSVLPLVLFGAFVHANEPPQGKNPALEQALKECHAVVDAKTDRIAFDACMKAKGFDRPKDKPKP